MIAGAISDTSEIPPEVAKLQGVALADVFQMVISGAGRRTRVGSESAEDR